MEKEYWFLFCLFLIVMLLGAIALILLPYWIKLLVRKRMEIYQFILLIGVGVFSLILGAPNFVVYYKDYELVSNHEYLEDDCTLIEYTLIENDGGTDTSPGEDHYLKPKFYIADKDEYIILDLTDLEIGKTYRIRYYPNSQIAEVLYCVDDMENET